MSIHNQVERLGELVNNHHYRKNCSDLFSTKFSRQQGEIRASQRLPANFPLTGVFLSDLEWGLVKFTQRARDITVYTGTTDQSFSYPSAKELWFGGLEKASGEEKQICIRPCLHGEKFIRVKGSHAYTSYSERANFLYISL